MRTVCVRAGLTLLALAVSAGAQSGGGPVLNGLWVYSVSSLPNAVSDEPTRDTLIQNSSASGVKWLYVSVYQSTRNGEGRYMYEDGDIADLITKAHMQGMQVYGAYGDTDWPTLGCDASAFPMKRMAEVIAYNAANPTAPFDGVMLDVEPGSSPDFVALLELYQCFQQQAQANGMGIGAAISAFWNTAVTFGQTTELAYQQIVDLKLNSIVVMGYRNTAGSSDCTQGDGVVCLDEGLIAYANSAGQANTSSVSKFASARVLRGGPAEASRDRRVSATIRRAGGGPGRSHPRDSRMADPVQLTLLVGLRVRVYHFADVAARSGGSAETEVVCRHFGSQFGWGPAADLSISDRTRVPRGTGLRSVQEQCSWRSGGCLGRLWQTDRGR